MVYYGNGSGLNYSIWYPLFCLTTVDLLLIGVVLETYFGDNYLGEIFLNLPLPVSLRPNCGVDLKNVYSSNKSVHWERRNMIMMGIKP